MPIDSISPVLLTNGLDLVAKIREITSLNANNVLPRDAAALDESLARAGIKDLGADDRVVIYRQPNQVTFYAGTLNAKGDLQLTRKLTTDGPDERDLLVAIKETRFEELSRPVVLSLPADGGEISSQRLRELKLTNSQLGLLAVNANGAPSPKQRVAEEPLQKALEQYRSGYQPSAESNRSSPAVQPSKNPDDSRRGRGR